MSIVELPEPILTTRGEFGDGLVALVTGKLAAIARHVHEPVLSIRVDLDRRADPAVALPVEMRVAVNVNGHVVHAAATGRNTRDAVDVAVGRLIRQLDDR
jgi:ribosome-associated translation inhibitor RaiA